MATATAFIFMACECALNCLLIASVICASRQS